MSDGGDPIVGVGVGEEEGAADVVGVGVAVDGMRDGEVGHVAMADSSLLQMVGGQSTTITPSVETRKRAW